MDRRNNFYTTREAKSRYAVILAGGDGTRLQTLTRAITGDTRPKQFCPILNDKTLLTLTQNRVALKVSRENIYYSLTQKHDRFYQSLLSDADEHQMVIQPKNKGTAPAILYSIWRLSKISPDVTVAFFPSDHYFSNDEQFMENVEIAFGAVELNTDSLILLGIKPQTPETSYGWIEPVESFLGNETQSISRVRQFWEKPDFNSAEYLLQKGCLWNSFVMVGKVSTFLDVFKKHLPKLFEIFDSSINSDRFINGNAAINSIYKKIKEVNFSSEVLEKATEKLYVMRVGNVEWSDWGEPNRVLGTLKNLNVKPQWMVYAT